LSHLPKNIIISLFEFDFRNVVFIFDAVLCQFVKLIHVLETVFVPDLEGFRVVQGRIEFVQQGGVVLGLLELDADHVVLTETVEQALLHQIVPQSQTWQQLRYHTGVGHQLVLRVERKLVFADRLHSPIEKLN